MKSDVETIDLLFLHIEYPWHIFLNMMIFSKTFVWFHYLLMPVILRPMYFFSFVELENRLLSRFDAASQRRELSTMAECAKILSQVSYGSYHPSS